MIMHWYNSAMSFKDPKWLTFNKTTSENLPERAMGAGTPNNARFFNRDISWLTFNDRVLAEAEQPDVPLLERLFFIGIVSSNLDEFFTVRVAELLRLQKVAPRKPYPDALTPESLALQVRERVLRQKSRQALILGSLLKALTLEGIQLYTVFDQNDALLDDEIEKLLPEMEMFVSKLSDPMPALQGSDLQIFIRFSDEFAVVRFKNPRDRLLELPAAGTARSFVLLDRWIIARAHKLFPKKKVIETFAFRLLRNADIPMDIRDEDSHEQQVIKAVSKRPYSRIVRLEIDSSEYTDGALLLAMNLKVDPASIYRFDLPLNLHFFTSFKSLFEKSMPHLLYHPIVPRPPEVLDRDSGIFSVIRKQDIILHHPYDSFDVVIDFLGQAARDPGVTEIFHTLYRTNNLSPITDILKKAAKNGKKVIVYVEIKARFDEMNNVMHASELRKAGVKVITPIGAYKVHSKITKVCRTENNKTVSYLHMGTGNYHAGTARQYTDLGLLTTNRELVAEASMYCDMLQGKNSHPRYEQLLVSPVNLHNRIISLIQDEIHNKKTGAQSRIIAKMNALTDTNVIEALYEASHAGVRVDLIIRGTCCLRPGVPGLSENIRVISIVDRFLEHSRIYYFNAGGRHKIYLSSADWRPRNFIRRYEIAFPITDPRISEHIRDVILLNSLKDNVKARVLQGDGSYRAVSRSRNAAAIRSQFVFEQMAEQSYANTPLKSRNAFAGIERYNRKYN